MSKPFATLLLAGPQGCGKSSLIGRLSAQRGAFQEDTQAEIKHLSKELGCPDLEHAWMLDRLPVEREQRRTVVASSARFESEGFVYHAIDAPGDPRLAGNMVAVTSQADIVVLAVPAAVGELEAALESGLQRELALCCFTAGIKHVVVAVTQMDAPGVDYEPTRYEEAKKVVEAHLKEVGYKQREIAFVPVSGLRGDNLVDSSANTGWYSGPSLLAALDAVAGAVNRPGEKPLRIPILKAFEVGDAGTVAVGRVETGSLRLGIKVQLSSTGQIAEIQSLQVGGKTVSEAKSGEVVGVGLGPAVRLSDVKRGMILSSASNDPAAHAESILAQVIVLDHPGQIRNGYCPSIAVHTAQVPCEFEELLAKIDRKTKTETPFAPGDQGAKTGDVVTVRMRPRAPVCFEAFSAYPSLGRFSVRDHGRTVAVGVVKEATKRPVPKFRAEDENQYFDD